MQKRLLSTLVSLTLLFALAIPCMPPTAAQQATGYATATREQALLIAVRLHNNF